MTHPEAADDPDAVAAPTAKGAGAATTPRESPELGFTPFRGTTRTAVPSHGISLARLPPAAAFLRDRNVLVGHVRPVRRPHFQSIRAAVALTALACGSPLEADLSNTSACGSLGRALLEVCGGELADATDPLFQYLNCNILPGCPGGQVETSDIDDCAARIRAQRDDDAGKPLILACRDALAVECTIARADCGDNEEPPDGALVGFWRACERIRATLGDDCLLGEAQVTSIADTAAGDADRAASLTTEAAWAACSTLLRCDRAGAFSDSDLVLALTASSGLDCEVAKTQLLAADVDRGFCAPFESSTSSTTLALRSAR